MSIRALADKWRGNEKPQCVEERAYNDGQQNCAFDLEAALPQWTQITDDPATWPTLETEILMASWYDGWNYESYTVKCFKIFKDELGEWWRPLCDLDHPPEQP